MKKDDVVMITKGASRGCPYKAIHKYGHCLRKGELGWVTHVAESLVGGEHISVVTVGIDDLVADQWVEPDQIEKIGEL